MLTAFKVMIIDVLFLIGAKWSNWIGGGSLVL